MSNGELNDRTSGQSECASNSVSELLALPTLAAARSLIGWEICVETAEGRVRGRIVETEAYTHDDPASHSYGGLTKRNAPMFGKPGTLYVYQVYGMHFCFNIVTAETGIGEAVLIRAMEPLEGMALMAKRRGDIRDLNLCSGPGKLCQALGISLDNSGQMLGESNITLFSPTSTITGITETTRIGISLAKDLLWRYYETDNRFISRR